MQKTNEPSLPLHLVCETEYSRIQDVYSQKAMMSRKIRIQEYLGDKELRDDAVKMYRQIEQGQWDTANPPSPFLHGGGRN